MRLVLRPLISYLESLVFRYIPLARGDVRKKKKEKEKGGGMRRRRMGRSGISSLPVRNTWRGFLVSWRFLAEA